MMVTERENLRIGFHQFSAVNFGLVLELESMDGHLAAVLVSSKLVLDPADSWKHKTPKTETVSSEIIILVLVDRLHLVEMASVLIGVLKVSLQILTITITISIIAISIMTIIIRTIITIITIIIPVTSGFSLTFHFCQGFYQGIGHGAHVRMEGTLAFGMMGLCRMESSMCLTPDAMMLQDTVDGSELRRSSPGMYKTL